MPDHDPSWQIHPKLLDTLLAQHGRSITPDALAQTTSLSTEKIQHELKRLTAADCAIDHHPQLGVTLTHTGCAAWVDFLQWSLGKHRAIVVYRQTASTQDAAKQRLNELGTGAQGSVILADQQYAGRGRLGRTWLAPPGHAATFSLIHVQSENTSTQNASDMTSDRLIFATAVAVARGIEKAVQSAVHAQIKWPNDILIQGKKVAGILVETISLGSNQKAAIIGVGINVGATPDLSQVDTHRGKRVATSLADHCPHADRLNVMAKVLAEMDQTLSMQNPAELVDDWRARSVLLSQTIALQTPQGIVQGEVIDLDPYEGLIVRTDAGALLHLPAATTSVM